MSLEKIEFLMRFVPHLRDEDKIGLEKLKQLEVHFLKEEYTKGYHVLSQGEKDEHLYFIFRGKCRLLLSTRIPPMATVFPVSIQERNEWLILDTLHKGQCFGELTAFNAETPSPYSVEVCSDSAMLLKIHIN